MNWKRAIGLDKLCPKGLSEHYTIEAGQLCEIPAAPRERKTRAGRL
jgi:hypothetical protein